ncbi:hypothetical protein N7481_012628 [Penicillium waksmanii]|uniref:uncharacterized protein n=1 Tax=Penicillium waksmanii TaxID=69791 RepID=UPI002548A582|nr:uncharacterized protein N7481_012628 [Penicillium waksmanii]KAJ5965914.1 hypothetical protein N7481_012628 [Penicillium waksmanii]
MTSIQVSFGDANSGVQVGINNGQIVLPAELPKRPPPLSNISLCHQDFISRDSLLDQIHRSSIPGSRIVLVGLGGVGKTQLAIEHCNRIRQGSPETWVFWIHASNSARCEQSLRDLADRVKIPGRDERTANIFQIFRNWLQDEQIGRWILVLDGVDDHSLLRETYVTRSEGQTSQSMITTQPPLRYLLECSNGSIIITSRNRHVALDITSLQDIIEVPPMEKAEALDLLKKKLSIYADHEDMEQLTQELEFMPMAIIQAASYITHSSPLCSVSKYLEDIRKNDRQAIKLLQYRAGLLSQDWEAKTSITLTWQISFDYIQRKSPSAADLLSLMSFFERQGIPMSILRDPQSQDVENNLGSEKITDRSSEEDWDSASDDDSRSDQQLKDDLITLRNFSFISFGENNTILTILTMHRLVQLSVRAWLKEHKKEAQWNAKFINNLCHAFPIGEYENWEQCRLLFPHVKLAVSKRPKSDFSRQQWAILLSRAAWYAQLNGNIAESVEMASKSKMQSLETFGADSTETLKSATILATAYRLKGLWRDAEQLEKEVTKISKTKLGLDHPSTLLSMNNLALIYQKQGRWKDAEQLFLQVLEISKTKLGSDHQNTLSSMNNLASIYQNQGQWKEAEQFFHQVMETYKMKLGLDHPNTLSSMNNLALTFWNMGRWDEAEQLQNLVMKARKMKLGADHPSTLNSMANLASTYWNQGRLKPAELLFLEVIEIQKTKLGADHPDTLNSMANLASTFWNQGRLEEAELLEVQIMKAREAKLGADHPDTLMSMSNLSITYQNQRRWNEAEQLEAHVLEARKSKLSEDHPDTLTSMANLAWTYRNQDKLEEAEQLFIQVVEMSKTKLGGDHPDTITGMVNLAFTQQSLGRLADAIDLLRTCAVQQRRILGPDHHQTVSSVKTLLEWETRHLAIEA